MKTIAWGAKVTPAFCNRIIDIADFIKVDPSWLMACIAFESDGTFSASVRNRASGATGLIQFMPQTAAAMGTSTEALSKMSALKQLDWVLQYFATRRGKLHTLDDVYMAILWPIAICKPSSYVLFDKMSVDHPLRYVQNAGLDYNKDGQITKGEAAARVRAKLTEGLLPKNARDI